MNNMYKICAVIVTYNRKELLLRNLNSLFAQSYPIDVVIYDNASTDGTFDYLEQNGALRDNVRYILGKENSGGAGGFSNGEKTALENDYDYLWLMDDDGYCFDKDTLKELVSRIEPGKKRILNSLVLENREEKRLTFPVGPFNSYEECVSAAKDGAIIGYGNPYNSTLIPAECFDEVGFTDERFFIYGDERDYFFRSQRAGYVWEIVLSSEYYHPINRNVIRTISFGEHVFEIKRQPLWKYYFEIRNNTYLIKSNGAGMLKMIAWSVIVALMSVCYPQDRFARLKTAKKAMSDAKNGRWDGAIGP